MTKIVVDNFTEILATGGVKWIYGSAGNNLNG
jgi:hypothetical protein